MRKTGLGEINEFTLRKQHLTGYSKARSIVQVVNDLIGLHATNPATPYLSLFQRTSDFRKEQLDEELYVKRNLGKIRCMRKTVHVLTKETIPIAYSATSKLVVPLSEKYSLFLGVTKKDYEETSSQILEELKGKGMSTKELRRALRSRSNISPIVNLMCDKGLLIRGKSKYGWRSNTHTYHIFQEYFPDMNLNAVDETEAKRILIKQYIASFGPVTENDTVWWTGFLKGEVGEILDGFHEETTWVEVQDLKGDYLMHLSGLKPLHESRPKKNTVNFLPSLDPYLMGYKDRERYLDHEYYDYVFDRGGNATSTILLNGRVIGIWDIEEDVAPTVKLFLFEVVGEKTRGEIVAKARETGRFIADEEVEIKECDTMVPLTHRTAGGVMSPLKDLSNDEKESF